MEIRKMKLVDLPEELSSYLKDLAGSMEIAKIKAMIPVYYRVGDEVFFITDYVLWDNKRFEKTAPDGLYRGGALLKLLTKDGQVVIYDERRQWLRLVGGIARFEEGDDLTKTAVREGIIEELAVLIDNDKIRLVPIGMTAMIGDPSVSSWGIKINSVVETGSLEMVNYFFNNENRAFEVVVQWDLSSVDTNLFVYHNEEWFLEGRCGFVPFVIDELEDIVGIYDGRHGFVPMPIEKLHPTLEAVL